MIRIHPYLLQHTIKHGFTNGKWFIIAYVQQQKMWNMSATNFCWYLFLFLDLIGLICGNFWSSQMDREYYPAQHHHQHHHHDTNGLLSSIIADSDRHPKDYVEHHYVIGW